MKTPAHVCRCRFSRKAPAKAWDISTEPKTSESRDRRHSVDVTNLLVSCWCMRWRMVCLCVCVWLINSSLCLGCSWDNRWLSGVSSLFFPWCPRLTSLRFSSWSFSEPGSGVQSGGAAHGQLRAGRTATHGHSAGRWDARFFNISLISFRPGVSNPALEGPVSCRV